MARVKEAVENESAAESVVEGATSNGSGAGRKPGTTNVPVTWALTPVSDLPPKRSSGFTRNPEVTGIMEQIKQRPGEKFEIAVYGQDDRATTSARAKASALRKAGYKAEDGWDFRVGESQTQPGHVALFVGYGVE